MSPPAGLIYIIHGAHIRRGLTFRAVDEDITYLEMFHRILSAHNNSASDLAAILEKSINWTWQDVYDIVHPLGDRRGVFFKSFWIFNLQDDILFLYKREGLYSAPLSLFHKRLMILADFKLLEQPTLFENTGSELPLLQTTYWEPKIAPCPRKRAFAGKIMIDFGYTWHHILHKPLHNIITITKFVYAIVWIARIEFTLKERKGFEHITERAPSYVEVIDLPQWETPEIQLFRTGGTSWVAFGEDITVAMDLVQKHVNSTQEIGDIESVVYTVLTIRQVCLCKGQGRKLYYTKPGMLFDEATNPPSYAAIDMIIWAANLGSIYPQPTLKPTTLLSLPSEIQDIILGYSSINPIALAKLGADLELGSPFLWVDKGIKIGIELRKRHRYEESPVESQIMFGDVMSGLSYKADPWLK